MKNKKQILALLLCIAMVVAMVPVAALQTNATTGVTYLVNNDFDSDEFDNEGVLKAELDGGIWTGVANGTAATAGDLSLLKIHTGQLIFTFNEAITDNYVVKFKYQLDGIGIDGASISTNERFQFFAGTAAGESSSQLYAEIVGDQDRITITEITDYTTSPVTKKQNNNYIKVGNVQQYAQWHEVEFHVSPSANKYQLYIDGVQYGGDYTYYYKAGEGTKLIRFLPKGSNANFDMLLDYVQVYTVPGDIAGATTTYINDGFDTVHPKWNNSSATVADGVITTNATNPDLTWTFPTGITENYTVEFKYRLDAVGTDGTVKQEAFALKMGSTTGQSNSQVYLSFTGAVDGASNQDRVKIQTAPGMTPKQFGTYGAWHKVKIVVDQTAKTYQLTVDGDLKVFTPSEGEPTTNIPLYNTAITELKTLFFDCDGVSNISLDYLRVYSGEATEEPEESVTEPSEAPTESEPAESESTPVESEPVESEPVESEPEETVPAETVPQIEGTKTHLNEDYTSETDGKLTLDSNTSWNFDGITDNYTVEFKYRLGGDAQELYYVKIGNSPSSGEAKSQAVMSLTGAATGASLDDRVKINNAQNVYYTNNKGCGLWHTVKIVVDQTAKTYNLYLDDVLQTYNSSTDIPYFGSGDTSCMNQIFFQKNSGTMELDYIKVYTEDVQAYQQATLGDNIHMKLTGSVSSYSGITSVKATLSGRTVEDTDMTDGFAFKLDVAAAEVGENIVLTGYNAENVIVFSKNYTVAEYLAEVKASDEATYGGIVDYTLNYAAAAAAYFGKSEISAPSVTMEEVPSALVGENITLAGGSGVEMSYNKETQYNGDYTVEFKYQLPSNSNCTVKIGPRVETNYSNVQIKLVGGTAASTDRAIIDIHMAAPTNPQTTAKNLSKYFADAAVAQWHTVKIAVNATNSTMQLWLDGVQITYNHDGDAETPEIVDIPCYTREGYTKSIGLKTVGFDLGGAAHSMIIDDFKVTTGETVYENDFTTFETATSGDNYWNSATVTLNEVEVNPVSGFCAGIMPKSATLLLKDKIEVRYSVSVLSGDISDYTFAINGEPAEAVLKDDGSYIITSKGILPQDYAEDMALTITKDAQSVSIAYNPMDYITRMADKTTDDAALLTLLQAMYNYYLSAAAYVAVA